MYILLYTGWLNSLYFHKEIALLAPNYFFSTTSVVRTLAKLQVMLSINSFLKAILS